MLMNLNLKLFNSSFSSLYSTFRPLINLKEILSDTEKLKKNALERRNHNVNVELINQLNSERIVFSKELARLNGLRKDSTLSIEAKIRRKELMMKVDEIEDKLLTEISNLPNWSCEESPVENNLIIKESFIEKIKESHGRVDHVDICKKFDLVDFEGPSRTSGAHFYALKGISALLEISLTSWTMNRAIQKGFTPISAPDVIKEEFIVACGFQPRRRAEDKSGELPIYTISNNSNQELVLAGTSEMFLASQFAGQSIQNLPKKYVATSHCFRSEVGHHTAASRGLYRVHQFTKIELFIFCHPSQSSKHFHEITTLQADLLNELGLPYRVLEMARWELGASAARKWDHEIWMPGRKIWGEVMSTSNCTGYQSRRLSIRTTNNRSNNNEEKLGFPYTLNGTACAVPRIIMALLEYGWNPNEPEYLILPSVLEQFYPTSERKYNNLTIKFE